MDYTLAPYKQEALDKLSIDATVEKLVKRGYPEWLKDIEYKPDFPIRGLLVDKKLGNVLKMDRYQYVKRAYHGYHELDPETRHSLYHARRLRVGSHRYHWIDTLYGLSEVSVYTAIIDLMHEKGEKLDFLQLFTDVRESIDEAHRDGTIHDTLFADPASFVMKDPRLATLLHKLRSGGKQLFLLTNSGPETTERMMRFLLEPTGNGYHTWHNYFDLIITAAKKPVFFNKTHPFTHTDEQGETQTSPLPTRGKVNVGGNLGGLRKYLDTPGDQILYIGDHIYGDVLRAKKETAWRTIMIVQEMKEELHAQHVSASALTELETTSEIREQVTARLLEVQSKLKHVRRKIDTLRKAHPNHSGDNGPSTNERQQLEDQRIQLEQEIEIVRTQVELAESRIEELDSLIESTFHPHWGSPFQAGTELSYFGHQVEHFACLYTDRVTNLLNYGPTHYYRSPRDRMPHFSQ